MSYHYQILHWQKLWISMKMFGQVDLWATCPPDKRKFFVISSIAVVQAGFSKHCQEMCKMHVHSASSHQGDLFKETSGPGGGNVIVWQRFCEPCQKKYREQENRIESGNEKILEKSVLLQICTTTSSLCTASLSCIAFVKHC